MNGEIIAVGSELLLGQIVNTNARFISEELANIGINVYYHTVIGDNKQRLKQVVEIAQQRADLIIFTGGLGPTKDDLTKETIASLLGVALSMDKAALQSIEDYFSRRNLNMTENNKKQALVFDGSEVLPNDNGMAPGMVLTKDGITYMLLPGPPSEMEPMLTTYGKNALIKRMDRSEKIQSRVLRFYGIGEASLEDQLLDLFEGQTNPTMAPLAANGEVTIRLTAKHASDNTRIQLLDTLEQTIKERVGEYFYGYDDTTLVKEMGKLIQENKLTLSVAESLTGGLFQEEVTSISGVSEWFKGGVVTYWPEVKINLLNVSKETIDQYGVVSEQCAKEMAENVRRLLQTEIGLSFTGVAGPATLEGKEPGTVFVGLSMKDAPTVAYQLKLSGNRESVRTRAVKNGAWRVIKALQSL
ncbi:competence/damage-inducible protein A [Caldibacillus lycopersici]|uniref:Putative competence-damage inducible protein n=1 Tax=Perspicuibacillus lycopersici TaxID=1325689 RepID=A0AAE3IRA2_9BACI|nr:competence/damage-inducible protein A [Perspicuibacillus lycopersici]MCU9612034.1 competence/damage-inducible protein A [Perspicuibacillus lycopersici]